MVKIFFSRTGKSFVFDFETWHVASGTQALQSFFLNDDPGLTLTYFTARSNLAAYTFEWGKVLQSHLMGKPCSKGLNRLKKCAYEKQIPHLP